MQPVNSSSIPVVVAMADGAHGLKDYKKQIITQILAM